MIIARTYNVDPNSDVGPLAYVVPLRETPFPGDIINLRYGRKIRVLRRTFNELDADSDDKIDVELGVRLA